MKAFFLSILVFAWAFAGRCETGEATTFYAQLIRGTDREMPEQVTWKPAGPKLSKQLSPKFRWKNYWEVSRLTIPVHVGKVNRTRLNPDREIEIDLRGVKEYEVRLFVKGQLTCRSKQSMQSGMSITGGARENNESWFVVVRRDKPTVD
jgi:hypothetical protein